MSHRTPVLFGLLAVLLFGLTMGLAGVTGRGRGPVVAAAASPRPASAAAAASLRSGSAASGPAAVVPPSAPPSPPGYDHVVVIVLENHSLETVIGSSAAPFLNSLAAHWSLATGYSGVSHPSLPNYLAMIGGSTYGISSDCVSCYISAPSLPDRLEADGKSWRAYMEGLPSPCYVGSAGLYAQKHDPFVYFDAIRNEPSRCGRVVPYGSFAADFSSPSSAPNFAFVAPNLCHDGHDCSLATADAWLGCEVPALLASPGFSSGRSLLFVTFDEGEGGSDRVATVLAGSGVRQGFQSSTPYDHYSLLRTIESLWGLAPVGAGDRAAAPMNEFFGG